MMAGAGRVAAQDEPAPAAASVSAAASSRALAPLTELREHPIVKDIEIRGLETVTTGTVLRVMQTAVEKPFDYDTFRRDSESIAALGTFDVLAQSANYEVVPGGVRIVIQLRENPKVRAITVIGNVKYNDKQILAEVPQKEGELLKNRAEADIRRSLRGFYRDAGYSRIQINVRRVPVEAGQIDLAIYIDEGERLKIQDMILEGNDSFPAWWIVPRLVNHGSWFFLNNYYDDELLQSDIETVRAFYVDRGFLDVKVRAGSPTPGKKPGTINPVIVIEEGQRYRVSGVDVKGTTLFLDPEVRAPFARLIGATYSGDKLRAAVRALRDLYGDEAFIDTTVKVDTVTDPPNGTVRLEATVQESGVTYVGQPQVDLKRYDPEDDMNFIERFFNWMSPPTKEKTVLLESRLKPGEKYRRYDEVRTIERLKRLQIFEKVNIRRESTPDPNVKDPVIEVEESSTAGYIGAAVGYGDITGAAVTLSYVNPNIAGEAKVLRASATFGQKSQRFQIIYLNRHWMDTDNSLEFTAYRYLDRLEGYRQRIYGTTAEVGHPLSEYLTAYMRLRLEDVKFRDRHDDREEPLDPYQTVAVRGMLDWDHRDDIVWPTRGFRVSGGVEGGYADGPLVKFLHGFGYYKRIKGDVIWAYEHDLGMMPYDHDKVGITERFFLGGSSDVRGFSARGASPVDGGYKRLRVGGATKFAQRNEIRFPIVGPLKGRVFVDDGFIDKRPWNFRNPRVSSGLGFIVDLRIVNVEVDFARAIVYRETDSRRLLHFRIASRF